MKKLCLFLSVVMLFSMILSGCGSESVDTIKSDKNVKADAEQTKKEELKSEEKEIEKEPLEITFVSPLIGLPVWLDAKYGAEAAGEEFGANISWVGPDTIDINAQVQLVEAAIAQKVDGIISCPLNPTAFEPVYKKAQEAGIPIVNTAVDSKEDTRLAYIGTDEVNFGKKAAEALAKKMNGKANIAVIQTSLDSGNQNKEYESFKNTIEEKYPNMKIIVRETDESDMLKAVDKVNAILNSYPEVNAIWCLEAVGGPAAAKVIEEKNLVGKITILAIDDMEDTISYIKKGTIWGTMTQNFYKMGYEAVKMIVESKQGKEVPSISDSGTTLVTLENVETYKK